MQFLKTLFWVIVAVSLVLFARENWNPVTLNLWAGLQADVKLPVLVFAAFLLGFLPTYLLYRGRVWTLQRRIERPGPVSVGNQPIAPVAPSSEPSSPADDPPGLPA